MGFFPHAMVGMEHRFVWECSMNWLVLEVEMPSLYLPQDSLICQGMAWSESAHPAILSTYVQL